MEGHAIDMQRHGWSPAKRIKGTRRTKRIKSIKRMKRPAATVRAKKSPKRR